LEAAKDEGIYIIYVDSPANTPAEARFLTNNRMAGQTAGEELLAALTADGVTSGNIGVINVNPATQSTVDREAGFRDAFAGTDFVILEPEFTEGDVARSQQAAQNFIVDGVVAIFGTNEGGSTGVGNAIEADGGTVLGVGFDTSDALLNHVRDGNLIAVMAQNPDVMGDLAVRAAAALLRGESLSETDVDTGVSVIGPDNL
jgi:ribose transport system substrate-binding protein